MVAFRLVARTLEPSKRAGIVGLALAIASSLTAAEEPWRGALTKGPHEVGFRSETFVRTTPDRRSRTLHLSTWYPAVEGTGAPARIADLLEIVANEGRLSELAGLSRAAGLVAAMTGDADALSPESAEDALELPTWSRLDARPAGGPFPLTIWSSRHATVLAQAPLSEALASRGNIVANVWSSDPPLAFLWEDRPESEKIATIENHTGDLQYALSRLRERDGVDPERTVVLAWSYGGQTAARLQEEDDGVVGVIGLDANVVPARPEERLRLRVPLVWLLGRDSSGRGLESVGDLTAPTMVIALPGLAHGNFNALEGFLPALFGTETVYRWSMGGPEAVDGYRALVGIGIEAVDALRDPDTSIDTFWSRASAAAGDVPIQLLHDLSSR